MIIHKDPPCAWVSPRPSQDASARYRKFGPIQPMEPPSLLARLFGGRL